MRAVVASGAGRYADPWHPFERTSPLIAGILAETGLDIEVHDDVDDVMNDLDGVDLLIVNAGDSWRTAPSQAPPTRAIDGLAAALDRGIGVLAMHCAVSSMRDYPEWFPAIGGMWLPGLSFHPPADEARITGGSFPDGTRVPDFDVHDELYCRIQRFGRSREVAFHGDGSSAEPVAWVRRHGRSRIAVDLLGHDETSYESEGHAHLLRMLAAWMLAED